MTGLNNKIHMAMTFSKKLNIDRAKFTIIY